MNPSQRFRLPFLPTVLAFGVIVASCDASSTSQQTFVGEHVTLTVADGLTACGDSLAFYDRFVDHAHRYWTGEPPPDDLQLHLELRPPSDDEDAPGGGDIEARSAWASSHDTALHELAHLVVGYRDGRSTPVLFEGVADAIGPSFRYFLFAPVRYDPREVLFDPDFDIDPDDYWQASQLVSFLIRRYGVPAVRDAYRAVDPGTPADEAEEILLGVFGSDFDAALTEFQEASRQCPLQAWECDPDVVRSTTLPLVIDVGAQCDDEAALGFSAATPELVASTVAHFTLDLDEETMLEVDVSNNSHVYFERCLQSCGPATFPDVHEAGFSDDGPDVFTLPLPLPPGRYTVIVTPKDPSKPFGAIVRRAGDE